MKELFEEMKKYAAAQMIPILRDTEVTLFCRLIAEAAPKRVLEIGTAIGYSTLQMVPLLPENGSIVTIEIDKERAYKAREYIARAHCEDRVTQLIGDAAVLLNDLKGPWDLVFLDGPKGQYSRQLVKLIPELSPRAVIIADNILYHGMVRIKGTIPHKHRTIVMRLREYLRMVTQDKRFETTFYENGDGMTVSYWKGYEYAENGIIGTCR
ncbi:MAG: O-methyltransferase [Megasphaera sp.]|uniref:O-methyltransferase n=1 Tax=Megasphaera sueciensis TaxID=349094 RepID=UPI003CFE6B5A|nr:O-methyltransferase [Megasphaera sp.]MCI1822938.1 O-methyltransferase [Megasphaera sp.]